MIKTTITSLLILLTISIHAQKRPSDKLFQNMALKNDITILSFSKEMLDFVNLSIDSEIDETTKEVTGDLHEVKVMICNTADNANYNFREDALSYFPKNKFKTIEPNEHELDDLDGELDIRVHNVGMRIKECHILFSNQSTNVLLSFFGNFKAKDVKALAEKLDNYR